VNTWSRPPRVVVIEDDPHVSRVLGRWLRSTGCATTLIASLSDALGVLSQDRWRESPHDVVTVDLALPDGDGFDAVVRATELVPQPIVAVASGRLTSERCVDLARLGVPYLVKPFVGVDARQKKPKERTVSPPRALRLFCLFGGSA
jgi:DNA-binding response OmpR family regulator